MPQSDDLFSQLEAQLAFLEAADSVLNIIDGYRTKLTERGYSSAATESMVCDVHRAIWMAQAMNAGAE